MALWLVRGGRNGEYEQEMLENDIITIGWDELPDMSQIQDKEQLSAEYVKTYPDQTKQQAAIRIGQIWSFLHRMHDGDLIAVPLKSQPFIAIGEVQGSYKHNQKSTSTKHERSVIWKEKSVLRSKFDQDILNGLGSILTIGQVRATNAEQRVRDMLNNNSRSRNTMMEDDDTPLDLEQISRDRIVKHLEHKFTGHDLARLIDGILTSKGYTTKLSPPGPDGGVDILAGSGKLGFDSPKICVQVKSSQNPTDVKILRELDGVTKKFGAEYGILVAWGGLTKAANQEIHTSFFTTKLWDQGKIVDELIENYDGLDDELKSEIRLHKIWTIVEEQS